MTTLLKCKMCGGTLEVKENETVARCKYCGSLMTLPRIDNDKKARLFNRANEYRLNNEFDKAYEAYKAIAAEDIEEPEAYWGMLLAEYGIEYVEDPKTGNRIPTCHRTLPTSIKNSSSFKLAIQYADAERKMMYEDEAEQIDQIQKRILAVSTREEPYDVFVCYKETDDSTGERTTDSVLAQDIYNELTKQGIKTFFSRITLEDKLGVDYEPYIYAALRSAKVMLVVTESADNCNAVWVKNEWMRFIGFMKEDSSKTIIPVYRNITAYELPSELSRFQSQDMAKIGAIQDLSRGVAKIIEKPAKRERPKENNVSIQSELSTQKDAFENLKNTILNIAYIILHLIAYLGWYRLSHFQVRNNSIGWEGVPFIYLAIPLMTMVIALIYGIKKGFFSHKTKSFYYLTYSFLLITILVLRFNLRLFLTDEQIKYVGTSFPSDTVGGLSPNNRFAVAILTTCPLFFVSFVGFKSYTKREKLIFSSAWLLLTVVIFLLSQYL